ncbi:lipid A deacylase LpxR family protein [Dyadobacter chenhuakuii]|uniref:Lipid A deacylase LpxR family protein n=1 Tax=Dyadobacter chenhuakuii TaxID=2909339 RepID=A0A9X1QA98_9BACT|nr:lipid A deacylase LpxR family protein [Dyadobacter chenhuakuii]MCF2496727.1 lipid A deacylase LpxR family protein [Dyadobacter chenhuakuii]
MKKAIMLNVLLIPFCLSSFSQGLSKDGSGSQLMRVYEDNDFLNIYGKGTDRAYSNGLSIDFYKIRNTIPTALIDRILPKAGEHRTDTYSWGITQLMYTPNNLGTRDFQPNDYNYSGALLISHALHSSNTERKYAIQSGFTIGLRGSASCAEMLQKSVHRLINDEIPAGWENQLQPKLLINLNFAIEKQVACLSRFVEIIQGVEISTGTLTNTASIYPLVRIGYLNPYFKGLISQYASSSSKISNNERFQAYFILKPKASLVLSNAMIQGKASQENAAYALADNKINNYMAELSYGVVFVLGSFGISYIQKPITPYKKGLYTHNVGNVSLYFNW